MEALLERQQREAASQDLARQARDRLRSQSLQALRDISVEVVGTSVVLRGKLNSFYQKQVAQEAVKQVDGIESISNEIEVTNVA